MKVRKRIRGSFQGEREAAASGPAARLRSVALKSAQASAKALRLDGGRSARAARATSASSSGGHAGQCTDEVLVDLDMVAGVMGNGFKRQPQ